MSRKDIIIGGFVVFIAALLAYVWLTPAGSDRAPEINMKAANGDIIAISLKEKRPVLINFWATTCTTCMQEIPHLIKLYEELQPQGLEVVGVSMFYDPPSQVMEMVKRKNIPYPIVFDLDKKIMRAFDMQRPITPTTILIDTRGKIVLRQLGMPNMDQLKQKIQNLLAEN